MQLCSVTLCHRPLFPLGPQTHTHTFRRSEMKLHRCWRSSRTAAQSIMTSDSLRIMYGILFSSTFSRSCPRWLTFYPWRHLLSLSFSSVSFLCVCSWSPIQTDLSFRFRLLFCLMIHFGSFEAKNKKLRQFWIFPRNFPRVLGNFSLWEAVSGWWFQWLLPSINCNYPPPTHTLTLVYGEPNSITKFRASYFMVQ